MPLDVAAVELSGEPEAPAEVLGTKHFIPFKRDGQWGLPWGTTWFRIRATVPREWAGRTVEALVDLGFDVSKTGFQAEALVYRTDLSTVKSINPRNQWIPVSQEALGGEEVEFFLEAASNPVLLESHPFLPTEQGDVLTASREPLYRLRRLDLVVFNEEVHELALDLDVLLQLEAQLPNGPRQFRLQQAMDDALDVLDLQDVPGTAAAARAVLAPVLASAAGASEHRLSAIGHSHIDTAWLWPQRETIRKVARTTSSMTEMLERHPEFRYGMSSAQQYAWLEEHRPEVFERVRKAVAEGRFEPLGGMWVESDTVMPSGESMVRQFLQGQLYFERAFGKRSRGVWLPDSFGYSPALPQLMRRAGFEWFFTQKISWNQVNRFPHHTFEWEGIDGSRIFSHFPPMDTYNAELSGEELAKASRQFRESRKASGSIAPVGWGDGGGGTTREMIGRARRLADLEGSPRVTWESPDVFFERAKAELPQPPVWVGELYLELHRAVTTSQHKTKQGNRRTEHLLVEAEWWATAAWLRHGAEYPYEELQRLWRVVLTHQFHDILPGTSIAWVHREARATYAEVEAELERIIQRSLEVLVGEGEQPLLSNASSFDRDGVAAGGVLAQASSPTPDAVSAKHGPEGIVLSNELVSFTLDARGLIVAAEDLVTGRDYVGPEHPANLPQLHQDFPNQWDAWDVDRFYRNTVTDLAEADVVELLPPGEQTVPEGPAADAARIVRIVRSFGDSSMEQLVELRPGERGLRFRQHTEWRETEKFLKLSFPLRVWASEAVAETQFGFHARPTHTNTSWEAAKFETSTQRWVLVGDRDGAAALANESSYGFDVTRDVEPERGVLTTLRLSLLRAPRYPDPQTDRGEHTHRYAFVIGTDELGATAWGQDLNVPARVLRGANGVDPIVTIEGEGVLLDAVKPSEDRTGDLIVRLHEAAGRHAAAVLRLDARYARVEEVSLLEDTVGPAVRTDADGAVHLGLTPFSVRTLRFVLRKPKRTAA